MPLLLVTGLFTAIYFIIFGGLALIVMRKSGFELKRHFIIAGLLCSAPMLVAVFFGKEIEWQIATVLSSIASGTIIAFTGIPKNVT